MPLTCIVFRNISCDGSWSHDLISSANIYDVINKNIVANQALKSIWRVRWSKIVGSIQYYLQIRVLGRIRCSLNQSWLCNVISSHKSMTPMRLYQQSVFSSSSTSPGLIIHFKQPLPLWFPSFPVDGIVGHCSVQKLRFSHVFGVISHPQLYGLHSWQVLRIHPGCWYDRVIWIRI